MPKTRSLTLIICAATAFAIVAATLRYLIPHPLGATDSMVVGAVATFAALAVLFVGLMINTRDRDIFFKRRSKH
jgi:hypothetical protein